MNTCIWAIELYQPFASREWTDMALAHPLLAAQIKSNIDMKTKPGDWSLMNVEEMGGMDSGDDEDYGDEDEEDFDEDEEEDEDGEENYE